MKDAELSHGCEREGIVIGEKNCILRSPKQIQRKKDKDNVEFFLSKQRMSVIGPPA